MTLILSTIRKIIGDPYTIPLEHRVFNIAAIVGAFMCFSSIITNWLLFDDLILILAPLAMLIMTIFLYYMSSVQKRHMFSAYAALSLLTFGLYPTLWITNGGSQGPVFMYYLLNGILTPFLLQGGRKYLMMFLNILTLIALYTYEFFYPQNITLYTSVTSRMIDHFFSFLVLMIVIFFLTQSVMNEYKMKVKELNKAKEKLKEKSEHDDLTGIFNRGYIMDTMEDDISKRSNVALIMLDIDNFKGINDHYGHQVGDQVIVGVAETIQSLLRKSDIVGRIGGEEFLAYLPDCQLEHAYVIAEKLRKNIEEKKWSIDGLHVTVSIGVVESCDSSTHIIDTEHLFGEVDKLLYESKNTGKNKVSIHLKKDA